MTPNKTTKEKLLECACSVFAEKGYHNTTIAEISENAGANIAAVNYHFNNKENLYQNVIIHAIKITNKYFPLDKNLTKDTSPEERLYAFIHGTLSRAIGNKPQNNLKKIITAEMATPTDECGTLISEHIKSIRNILLEIIKDLTNEKDINNHHFHCVYSIISQCMFFSYTEKGRKKNMGININELISIEQLTKHIYDFSLAGIKNSMEHI